MSEFWYKFIVAFCKVEFLCYAREPNWLGLAIILSAGFVVLMGVLGIIFILTDVIVKELERLLGPNWYKLILSVILCLTLILWVIVV